jgi:hypothetical protein
MLPVNTNPTTKDLRNFAIAMLIGFGVLGGVLWLVPWWKSGLPVHLRWTGAGAQVSAICLWTLGVVLFALGLAPRPVARTVYVFWMSMAMAIGTVVTTILLTAMFIAFLPWFAIIVRFGDPLRRKLHKGETYWEDYKPYPATIERMQRPF